jgi:hypothetical protein
MPIRELLFVDNVPIVSYSVQELQSLLSAFSDACSEFGLAISKKKTQIMVQSDTERRTLFIDNEEL